ncbi:MAG: 8-oxoguanine deaminase [Roseitalea porphyridii]|uniref:8-oxoguanine deaminase n=1 Tax=Roseitalea porphyridii TaxID=1852022 RepID=UPI0032D92558
MGETGKGRAIFLRQPLAILTPDGVDARGGLLVRGGVIEQVFAPGEAPAGDVETVDVSRHVVLPGLVNTHHHFYQTLTRAHPAAINRELFDWLTALYPLWARLTPDHLRIATRLALTELMLSGVTCASDHHYVFPEGLDAAMDIQAEEAAALGIRIVLNRGSMNLSVRDGGLPPDSVVQDADTILADCERVIARHHDARPGAMTQVALAPCSPFSVTRELMVGTAELAARCGCALHTHLAETFDENAFCEARYGCRPLDYLEQTGWLTDRTWLAHGVHFDDDELVRLGAAGVGVCHCPTSNMVLASGQCRTRDLEAAGAPVGLGVDGSASNDSSNLMEGVRHALMIGRLTYDAALTHLDALRWATEGSARCLGRGDIGAIAEGRQADLALFTLDELRFSGAHDPLAALVLCGAHRADRVMIAGRWTVVDGQPVGVDMQALRAAHGRAALDFASG